MTDLEQREPMDDNELVECMFGCPRCGEHRVDWLVWIDDAQVECSSCGTVYEPQA